MFSVCILEVQGSHGWTCLPPGEKDFHIAWCSLWNWVRQDQGSRGPIFACKLGEALWFPTRKPHWEGEPPSLTSRRHCLGRKWSFWWPPAPSRRKCLPCSSWWFCATRVPDQSLWSSGSSCPHPHHSHTRPKGLQRERQREKQVGMGFVQFQRERCLAAPRLRRNL